MWRAPKYSQSEFFFHNCNSNKEIERFSYDLENGFGKCSFFVVSKDQNMASSFPRQRKPYYGEGIVLLANRVAQYDFKAKYRLISRKFAGMKFFHPRVRLTNQKRKTKYDQFLVILDNTRVRKSKPNFFRSESVSILSIGQTYTYKLYLGNALKSSVYTVYTKGEYMRQEAVCHYSFAQMASPFIRL